MSIEEYPKLDLTPFVNDPNLIVHCPEEWQAECFLANMRLQFPDQCIHWRTKNTNWSRYKEKHTFAPNIGSATSRKLEYCSRDYWITKGPRPIIGFDELLHINDDYGEIDGEYASINEFFGFQITEGE